MSKRSRHQEEAASAPRLRRTRINATSPVSSSITLAAAVTSTPACRPDSMGLDHMRSREEPLRQVSCGSESSMASFLDRPAQHGTLVSSSFHPEANGGLDHIDTPQLLHNQQPFAAHRINTRTKLSRHKQGKVITRKQPTANSRRNTRITCPSLLERRSVHSVELAKALSSLFLLPLQPIMSLQLLAALYRQHGRVALEQPLLGRLRHSPIRVSQHATAEQPQRARLAEPRSVRSVRACQSAPLVAQRHRQGISTTPDKTLRRLSRMPSLTARLPCVGASLEKMASVLEPVSIRTVKLWRGEPTDTLTKYSVRLSLIEMGT